MAFISEIHYDNAVATTSGIAEYVEISLTAEEFARANEFTVATYQLSGDVAVQATLDTLPYVIDPDNGLYVFTLVTPTSELDSSPSGANSGEAEAIALVDTGVSGGVISFYDIGGGTTGIAATSGPAAGSTSTTIVAASGQSIQFDKYGTRIDGALTQNSTVVCFAQGTRLNVRGGGTVLIEALRPGDMVETLDAGAQEVLYVHRNFVSGSQMRCDPSLRPVRLQGKTPDSAPLFVSQLHRLLLEDTRLDLMFGSPAMFAEARHLAEFTDRAEIVTQCPGLVYYHVLLERHHVLIANGHPAESFFAGDVAFSRLPLQERRVLADRVLRYGINPQALQLAYPQLRHYEMAAVFGSGRAITLGDLMPWAA